MKSFNSQIISEFALKSLIEEVNIWPKPGLVDKYNSGSHKDMDIKTFIKSSYAIKNYFGEAFNIGLKQNINEKEKIKELKKIGLEAEKEMYIATKNVNTHKGIIFSLGYISMAIGILENENEKFNLLDITNKVSLLCKGITKDLEVKNPKTYGEKIYIKYGAKGIRKEAEEGFIKALDIGVINYKRCLKNLNPNDSLLEVLIYFMATLEDSNVLGRGSIKSLIFVKKTAKKAIDLGAMHTKKGREYIYSLNKIFIDKNISPGGSADYLVLTYFLYLVEKRLNIKN